MRMLKSVREALDKAADAQSRNRANMAEYILASWLRDNHFLHDKP